MIPCLSSSSSINIPRSHTEACFLPLLLGLSRLKGIVDDGGGVVGRIISCLTSCDQDIRSKVAQNIIVCGGGAGIPG
jgi:hypothetical protein